MTEPDATPAADAWPACPDYTRGLSDPERVRCEVWTRVMGYHRPVSALNAGKRAEHAERRHYTEPGAYPWPHDGGDLG